MVRYRRSSAVLAACVALIAALAGCSTGTDAVATGGTFDFVSPGGKTDIYYDPPATRGTIGKLSGPELLTGKTVSVSDFPNQVVVLNLWGQWCGPCRSEAPALEQVYEQSKARGVAFLGINVRDPQRDKAQDFVTDFHVGYPSIYDPEMRTLLALGGKFPTSVIPTTLVLDRQHRVAAVFLRSLLAADLQQAVDRIAAEGAQ
ncbi:TlpA disulfide reductase family protein [Nocardia blacklockiae]|uniref:TlpA disulfide reductase family protein n=1 Tax=Nocardia blacklockiae TaxID=480036 RepID=UPI001895F3E6|nr:TlpA disulfide reductase family protein [Nocardia blacklockiae]MBF6172869.1 TlpA family protein disulfide reductase [Nocardia blacklockiae]